MKRSFLRISQLAATLTLAVLAGCDRNSQAGLLQQPRGTKGKKAVVTPDQAYDEMFITSTSKLSDSTYLIIARAERGSTFVVHTGPRPASDHAVCFSSTNNPGFRECVTEYYRNAGVVAIQSNEAGWWATPL